MLAEISAQTGCLEFDQEFGKLVFFPQANLPSPSKVPLEAFAMACYLVGAQTALRVNAGLTPYPPPKEAGAVPPDAR